VTAAALGTINTNTEVAYDMSNAASTDIAVVFGDGTTADFYGSATVAADATAQEAADTINNANVTGIAAFVNDSGNLQVVNSNGADVVIAESGATGSDTLGLAGTTADEAVATATTLSGVAVDTVGDANFAIARIDSALTAVNGLRGNLGAIQNRFESTIVNLQTVSENLAASRGRIQDADFAAETAALTKAQILQQAGVAVLSQANAQPQLALSLLQ
jgi:flagellin